MKTILIILGIMFLIFLVILVSMLLISKKGRNNTQKQYGSSESDIMLSLLLHEASQNALKKK